MEAIATNDASWSSLLWKRPACAAGIPHTTGSPATSVGHRNPAGLDVHGFRIFECLSQRLEAIASRLETTTTAAATTATTTTTTRLEAIAIMFSRPKETLSR